MELHLNTSRIDDSGIRFATPPRILIADDVSLMQNLMRGMLLSIGVHKPEIVYNGSAALRSLRLRPVDLVIADWHMPEMNGLELLRRIRVDSKLKDTRFLMVTSDGEPSSVARALEAGANGFLTKPISRNLLIEKVTEILIGQTE